MLLRRVAWILVAAALTAGGLRTAPAAAASGTPSASIVLVNQNATVSPASPGEPAAFTIGAAIRGPEPPGAQIALTFYDALHSTGAFEQTLAGPPSDVLHRVAPAPVSALASVGGAFQLTTTIEEGELSPPGSDVVGLGPCTVGTSACSGVYPVVVDLDGATGSVLSHFTTYLTYVETKSTQPLVFSWVAPLSSPVRIRTTGPLSSALATPDASRLDDIEQLLAVLAANPSVEESVAPSPLLVEAMATHPTLRSRDALAALRLFASTDARRLLLQPYVPINLAALSAVGPVGLTTEIKGQMVRAEAVLTTDLFAGLPPTDADALVKDIWVARGGVGAAIVPGMRTAGAETLVLPDTDLAAATEEDHATWAQPFELSTSRGDVEAAVSDSQLTPYFTPAGGDDALAAYQLLANLAMLHFEIPYADEPRGIIAVPPADWDPDPQFVAALVGGLSTDPVVTTATLDQFFVQVPRGANGAAATRKLPGTAGAPFSTAQAAAIAAARSQVTGFDKAVQGHPTVEDELGDLLLASESSELSTRGQRAGLASFERRLAEELAQVRVLSSTITLTARTASLPITIVSSAAYPLRATLTLSSSQLEFPSGATRNVTIDRPTNPTNVEVRARTTGDLPLSFTLTSPGGGLVIARGRLTVRSTATSIWGIVLTVVAAVVLLGWWIRTWRRGRRLRRAGALRGATP